MAATDRGEEGAPISNHPCGGRGSFLRGKKLTGRAQPRPATRTQQTGQRGQTEPRDGCDFLTRDAGVRTGLRSP